MLPEVSHDDTKDIKRVRRVTIAVGDVVVLLQKLTTTPREKV